MADATTIVESHRKGTRLRLWLGVGGIVLLLLAAGGLALWGDANNEGAFWFTSLVVVIVMALATAAVIFSGLSLADAGEAFGLPSGSVRAILAMGIMVLLVVFGLKLLQPVRQTATTASATITVPQNKLDAALAQYKAANMAPVVTDWGKAADAANATEIPSKVELYPQTGQDPDVKDMGKQIVTGVLTLLTTVIGFYFGSRSTTDGIRSTQDPPAISQGLIDLSAQRKKLGTDFTTLDTSLQNAQHQIDQARTAAADPDKAAQDNRLALQKTADANLALAATARDAFNKALADADAALTALKSATGDQVSTQEAAAKAALKTAADSLAKLQALGPTLADEAKQLISATAKG